LKNVTFEKVFCYLNYQIYLKDFSKITFEKQAYI